MGQIRSTPKAIAFSAQDDKLGEVSLDIGTAVGRISTLNPIFPLKKGA